MAALTVFFDYSCPFAWRGLELMALVLPQLQQPLVLRHFSLEQGNHPANAGLPRNAPAWKLWEQPAPSSRSLPYFLASQAAAQQGSNLHFAFALALMRLRHEQQQDLKQSATWYQAAQQAGLDLPSFTHDLSNESLLRQELASHLQAAGELAVFGTPTFVLPTGQAAYFRFRNLPANAQDALELWRLYQQVLFSDAQIETIKRPRK